MTPRLRPDPDLVEQLDLVGMRLLKQLYSLQKVHLKLEGAEREELGAAMQQLVDLTSSFARLTGSMRDPAETTIADELERSRAAGRNGTHADRPKDYIARIAERAGQTTCAEDLSKPTENMHGAIQAPEGGLIPAEPTEDRPPADESIVIDPMAALKRYDVYHKSAVAPGAIVWQVETAAGMGEALKLARKKYRNLDPAGFEIVPAGQPRPTEPAKKPRAKKAAKPRADAKTAPARDETTRRYEVYDGNEQSKKLGEIHAITLAAATELAEEGWPKGSYLVIQSFDPVLGGHPERAYVNQPAGSGALSPSDKPTVFDHSDGWRTTPIVGLKLEDRTRSELELLGLVTAGAIADFVAGHLSAVYRGKTRTRKDCDPAELAKVETALEQLQEEFHRERAEHILGGSSDRSDKFVADGVDLVVTPATPPPVADRTSIDLSKIGGATGPDIPRAALRVLARNGIRTVKELDDLLLRFRTKSRTSILSELPGMLVSHPAKILAALDAWRTRKAELAGELERAASYAAEAAERSIESRQPDGDASDDGAEDLDFSVRWVVTIPVADKGALAGGVETVGYVRAETREEAEQLAWTARGALAKVRAPRPGELTDRHTDLTPAPTAGRPKSRELAGAGSKGGK